jgi:hypothetical protein
MKINDLFDAKQKSVKGMLRKEAFVWFRTCFVFIICDRLQS